jgi:methylated-DNA-[protein]-cysteine S-methyltransferase
MDIGAGSESTPPDATRGYTTFDTAIGPCGLAWSNEGISGVALPEATRDETEARLASRFPTAQCVRMPLPKEITHARDAIVGLLGGLNRDLTDIALDMRRVSDFDRRVYTVTRGVPPGKTITYGEIAARIDQCDPRAIGQSMARNPFPIIMPCHRVVAAGGGMGGLSGAGGVRTKIRLLQIEGAVAPPEPTLFDFCHIED